jgi:hypothetical protein
MAPVLLCPPPPPLLLLDDDAAAADDTALPPTAEALAKPEAVAVAVDVVVGSQDA